MPYVPQHFQPMHSSGTAGPSYVQQQQQHYAQHQQVQMQHQTQDVLASESYRAMQALASSQPYANLRTDQQQQRDQTHGHMIYGGVDPLQPQGQQYGQQHGQQHGQQYGQQHGQLPQGPASIGSFLGDVFSTHTTLGSPTPVVTTVYQPLQPMNTPRTSHGGGMTTPTPVSTLSQNPDQDANKGGQ